MSNLQLNLKNIVVHATNIFPILLIIISSLYMVTHLEPVLHCSSPSDYPNNLDNTNSSSVWDFWGINTQVEVVTTVTSELVQENTALGTTTECYCNNSVQSDGLNASENDLAHSPLDQFIIRDYLSFYFNVGYNIKFLFTNMSFYLVIISGLVFVLNVIYNKLNLLTSNYWSFNKESLYATINGVVTNQIDLVKGQNFIPFIYTIFIYIFISNLVGMIPYNFSTTSHFILTFFISFTIVVGSTILGFTSFKTKFFSILVPSGCPTGLLPLLVLIETISYLARNVSLGLRLAANILSGHMLLNILSGFTYNIMASGFIFFVVGLIPLTFIIGFSTLEMGICFIQAQVFSVLSSSYIKDGIVLH